MLVARRTERLISGNRLLIWGSWRFEVECECVMPILIGGEGGLFSAAFQPIRTEYAECTERRCWCVAFSFYLRFEKTMRFRQLDKITVLVPGERGEAEKTLTGREDYLRDHFPRFAVQPGVLMLESLYQAAQILVRATDDYRRFSCASRSKERQICVFLQPGKTLFVEVEILKRSGSRPPSRQLARTLMGNCASWDDWSSTALRATQTVRSIDMPVAIYRKWQNIYNKRLWQR